MPHTIEFLEQALRLWEDSCFLNTIDSSFGTSQELPEKHWPKLRPTLLKTHQSASLDERFMDPITMADRWMAADPRQNLANLTFFKQFPLGALVVDRIFTQVLPDKRGSGDAFFHDILP